MLLFSTQLCKLLPFSPSPWFNSPPSPLPCLKTVYSYTVCKGEGGMGFWASDICRKVYLQVNFLDYEILHCLL
jgi:hypothetical protein